MGVMAGTCAGALLDNVAMGVVCGLLGGMVLGITGGVVVGSAMAKR